DLRVLLQRLGHLVEERIADRLDGGLVEVELDLLEDEDLLLGHHDARAAVLLRILLLDPGLVRAGVVGIEDPVAVAIRRAAVLLRILVGHAGHVGAGVLVVDDRVAVAVGRAAVLGRIVALDAGGVGTGIDLVVDPVAVAVAGRRTAVLFGIV